MTKLKKVIGKKTLLILTINAILGTGIFFLPGVGAAFAGPASIISWIFAAIIAIFMSCYFAELASMFPKAGGIYEYVKKSFGEFPSFIIGWIAWIVTNITIAMLIVGSLFYLFPGVTFLFSMVLSIFIIILFNYISYRGISCSAKLLLFFGMVTILSLLSLILPGFLQIEPSNFVPFFVFPSSMIFLAIFFIFETFFGWETTTYLAEEIKNARRVMPRILVIATIIIAVLSLALVFVSLGVVNWETFSQTKAPLSYLAGVLFGSGFEKIFSIIIFVPIMGTVAAWIISSPRLLYAMSRGKALPSCFKKVHPKYRTPYMAILLQTIVTIAVVIIGFGSYFTLLSLLLPLVIISYSAVLLSLVSLRFSKPHIKRYFRAPFGEYIPVLLLLVNVWLIYQWIIYMPDAWSLFIMGLILVFIGFPLYAFIKLQTDVRFTERFYDRFSWFWDRSFQMFYGEKEMRRVIRNARIKKGMTVLDFGCGTGLTTLGLAKRVGESGKIVAVDLSKKQMERAIKKIEKAMEISNVVFIKEQHLAPFEPRSFDAVTAVGVLEHLPYPAATIKDVIRFLKPGGHFSFLAFGKSFALPASEFLSSEDEIKRFFKGIGCTVKIERHRKRFTDYWFISGRKHIKVKRK